jgi:hypothetical protein
MPMIEKWTKKMWYLYTVEVYSATRKNEILSIAGKWMEQENIILSEVSQVQKVKGCMFSLICRIQIQVILQKTGHAKGKSLKREGR